MNGGWPRCGLSSAPSCRLRRPGWWRSGAGRWAASSRCCTSAGTALLASILKHRRGPGTARSSSSAMTSRSLPTRSWRALPCTTSPTSARCWTWRARRWYPEVSWWAWNGPGKVSTRRPPAGASTGFPRRTRSPAGCTIAVPSGKPPARPGTPTAGPGRTAKACIQAGTSCASCGPGSRPGNSNTDPISSPTSPEPAKPTSARRSTRGRSKPTVFSTAAGSEKAAPRPDVGSCSCRSAAGSVRRRLSAKVGVVGVGYRGGTSASGSWSMLDDLSYDDSEPPTIGLVPAGVSWDEVRDHIKTAHSPLLVGPDPSGQFAGAYWAGTELVVANDLGSDQEQALLEFRDFLHERGEV